MQEPRGAPRRFVFLTMSVYQYAAIASSSAASCVAIIEKEGLQMEVK
jgi:hypothetical protein